ncbi:2-phospho-L-lactate guanylyltransferase [Halorussus gelatinilyticus]|uniref:2-phospho-L-lactate guanylyltransferase n=1 Tax=Halorussus gelatinilyticus TaxID=2937524 RepID=A0A8U0ILZ4_9EURY|nr:2-phospho-L-lactate guanylyltransferase [Halorussus gelatinilyticus]UPW01234.1 2-phospho-L-lactate guanylyltransferase [Halorussus gelatinilyticus]
MRVVVPYAAAEPKTRLADALSADERSAFAEAMLADVLAAVRATGRDPEILATEPVETDAPVVVDPRPLTGAVNAVLAATDDPVAVVMADLALATPDALARLFDAEGEVVLAPGRGGGTNALVARADDFRVDYHGTSYLDHRAAAREVGADATVVDSHRLATDVDERGDLAEVLIHGGSAAGERTPDGAASGDPRETSRARSWLRRAGFALADEAGRTTVERGEAPSRP